MKNLEQKKEIRQKIKKLRSSLDPLLWKEKTKIITDAVIHHRWFQEAADIYCYIDFNQEVGTSGVIKEAWRQGKNVWAPKVSGENMEFCSLTSFEELVTGAYGILEPNGTVISEQNHGLMLVPGVAFDKQKNRIGYGKGYYDRYLKAHPLLHTIALAFELQIVGRIEAQAQDIKPELLLTESCIYK